MAMAALMLATTSCQKEGVDEPQGEYANVTFTAQLPSGINQRAKANGPRKAYSDGKTATTLHYAVYEDGKTVPLAVCNGATEGTATFANGSLTTTVTLKLPTDKQYDIIFFAQSNDAPYEFSAENHNFTIKYENVKANDENLDAFYAKYDYDGTTTDNQVTLKRPFAQLNIGTDDLEEYNKANPNGQLTETAVTVTGVGEALDLLNGTVSNLETRTFTTNAIPTEGFVKEGYKYLAMDYLLVNNEQTLVDVTLNSNAKETVGTYTNVPVQRNYRTNIFGSLLTNASNFNVTIDPNYDGDNDYNLPVLVSNDAELAEAVKTDGANVKLAANTTFAIPTTIAKGVTILGTDKTSVLDVKNTNGYNQNVPNMANVTFKGLTIAGTEKTEGWYPGFKHSTNLKFEDCELKGEMTLYADVCTFTNCTFTQTSYQYCIFTYGCQKPTFTNCTFNTVGKAVKVFNEDGNSTEATFNNCNFIATSVKDKAAITIDDSNLSNSSFTVYINGCTQSGFTTGEFVKKSFFYDVQHNEDTHANHTTVVIDGEEQPVYPE